MEEVEDKEYTIYRYACALNRLLTVNKNKHEKNRSEGIEELTLNYSYEKISAETGLRAATISNIFTGISEAKIHTLDMIIKALGANYAQFGEILDSLSKKEILEYRKEKLTNSQ